MQKLVQQLPRALVLVCALFLIQRLAQKLFLSSVGALVGVAKTFATSALLVERQIMWSERSLDLWLATSLMEKGAEMLLAVVEQVT
uniref:Uncharacterized protein n=1 Tax=Rhizophora mucronata TaxID=61149 RepID=A0A2P2NND2_RHIMU